MGQTTLVASASESLSLFLNFRVQGLGVRAEGLGLGVL